MTVIGHRQNQQGVTSMNDVKHLLARDLPDPVKPLTASAIGATSFIAGMMFIILIEMFLRGISA